jgi:chromosome segregation ATPase
MSEREDYDRLADELADEADKLERENKRLQEEISDARQDWERKRADPGVPGAPPPPPQDAPDESEHDQES